MAKIEVTTRNGDKLVVDTNDRDKIRQLENAPFDEASNVLVTSVSEDDR